MDDELINMSVEDFCKAIGITEKRFNKKKNCDEILSTVEISIHEGKNRQVRKMCKAINHPVLRLKRVAMGKITLNDCKVGEYRHLTEAEVNYLKSI